jgi:hypothetical protein
MWDRRTIRSELANSWPTTSSFFDLDVGRAQAEAARPRFTRIESLNTSPRFIDALATPGVDSTAAVPSGPIRFQPRGRRSREV